MGYYNVKHSNRYSNRPVTIGNNLPAKMLDIVMQVWYYYSDEKRKGGLMETKTKQIQIRLTPTDYARISYYASNQRKRLSTMARDMILDWLDQAIVNPAGQVPPKRGPRNVAPDEKESHA